MTPCPECGAIARDIDGRPKEFQTPHTPDCSKGRCGFTWNPGAWPYTTRCVKLGKDNHGDKHESPSGAVWEGEFITLDQALEEVDS